MTEKNTLEQPDAGMRRGVERRLEFIEYRIYWEGGVNRSDITDAFGVSVPQASNDLAQYRERAPNNIEYHTSEKRYLPTPEFAPLFFKPNASQYLVELKSVADHVLPRSESWIGQAPAVDAMPIPGRRVDPFVLKALLEAMRLGQGISAHYHSMSAQRLDAMWRDITPHAFGFDGLRWHVRAYCHIEHKFKDFVLSRFLGIGNRVSPGASPEADRWWSTFFDVVLRPNPELPQPKRDTIARDYDMADGQMTLKVRYPLLYYFNKRLRLDVGTLHDDPYEVPIVVVNKAEFEAAIEDARQR